MGDHGCNRDHSLHSVASWLSHNVGKNYVYRRYVPTENDLKTILSRGPIAIRVRWSTNAGHFVTIGGTNGHGDYWLHDSWQKNQAGKYQVLTYSQIKRYKWPHNRAIGIWDWTMFI